MHEINLATILLTTSISFFVALIALWVSPFGLKANGKSTHSLMIENDAEAAFLFDDDTLIDATPAARKLLGPKTKGISDWQRLLSSFSQQFSTLADDLRALGSAGTLTILPDDPEDTTRVEAEWWDGLARLVVTNTDASEDRVLIDNIGLAALKSELETLRRTAKLAPYLVWQETRDGQICWANAAYLSLAKTVNPDSNYDTWPPAKLFDHPTEEQNALDPQTIRVSIGGEGSFDLAWFDLTYKQANESTFYFATPADMAVRAETSLKEFVQTLTKTFAHLSIGLAVFDKTRQLALFNPALTDLTKLPVDFLSARPTLFSLLDRLRENQMMPEPKDYKSWRHQMTALEEAAIDGTYEETWTLPSGQTYRVNGRPHPDGAVALLFEDISAEISLTRNFREELEVGQSVLDSFEEAIVVFSSSGLITISNSAYVDLWGVDPSTTFGEMSIVDATRCWQEICDPTNLWDHLKEFVSSPGKRSEWLGEATLDDGRVIVCKFTPLAAGATMVSFKVQYASGSALVKPAKTIKNPVNV